MTPCSCCDNLLLLSYSVIVLHSAVDREQLVILVTLQLLWQPAVFIIPCYCVAPYCCWERHLDLVAVTSRSCCDTPVICSDTLLLTLSNLFFRPAILLQVYYRLYTCCCCHILLLWYPLLLLIHPAVVVTPCYLQRHSAVDPEQPVLPACHPSIAVLPAVHRVPPLPRHNVLLHLLPHLRPGRSSLVMVLCQRESEGANLTGHGLGPFLLIGLAGLYRGTV